MDKVHIKRGLVIVLICIVVGSVWGLQWKTLDADPVSADILQPGDILFVDIYEGWCHAGFWDHLGLYVGGEEIVEATFSGGITMISLQSFLERDGDAKIGVRRPTCSEEDIRKIIDYAEAQVDKPFDFTASTSFPLKFNEKNLHCTELIWRAFKEAGIDIDVDYGLFVYPDDIYFSLKMTEIG